MLQGNVSIIWKCYRTVPLLFYKECNKKGSLIVTEGIIESKVIIATPVKHNLFWPLIIHFWFKYVHMGQLQNKMKKTKG